MFELCVDVGVVFGEWLVDLCIEIEEGVEKDVGEVEVVVC